jgi:hypothetical protein
MGGRVESAQDVRGAWHGEGELARDSTLGRDRPAGPVRRRCACPRCNGAVHLGFQRGRAGRLHLGRRPGPLRARAGNAAKGLSGNDRRGRSRARVQPPGKRGRQSDLLGHGQAARRRTRHVRRQHDPFAGDRSGQPRPRFSLRHIHDLRAGRVHAPRMARVRIRLRPRPHARVQR